MRMRHKRNLPDRLERCGDYIIALERGDIDSRIAELDPHYIDYRAIFGNDNPVHLEIGCGMGRFACESAIRNPDINYIAVEQTRNVVITGCERAMREEISNLRFMTTSAIYLRRYIPRGSIGRIYLNFSCPYPKSRNSNRRLTNERFLGIYRDIMASGAEIHQKTDNMHFFEYSLEQYSKCGFILKNLSLDLHASRFEGNIMTEYEERFTALGKPIYRVEAYLPRREDC